MINGTLLFVFYSVNTTCFAKKMVNARIVVAPLFQMIFQFSKPFFVVCSLEQMRLMRRAWLYGIPLVQCLVCQLCGDRYWCLSVDLLYMSADIITLLQVVYVSRKEMLFLDVWWVKCIVGWTLLTWSKKRLRFSSDSVHFMSTSSMNKGNNKITELRTILQRESQNS